MARQPRVLVQEGLYHVISRGNSKQNIFRQNQDYDHFLSHINKLKHRHGFLLPCYCLMKNHFHLMIKTNANQTLTQIMHSLLTSHSMYINYKYERVGHLFQNRFKSFMVQQDQYLITLIDYIHNNPVRAGLVEEPSKYMYSSAKSYSVRKSNKGLVDSRYIDRIMEDTLGVDRTVLV